MIEIPDKGLLFASKGRKESKMVLCYSLSTQSMFSKSIPSCRKVAEISWIHSFLKKSRWNLFPSHLSPPSPSFPPLSIPSLQISRPYSCSLFLSHPLSFSLSLYLSLPTKPPTFTPASMPGREKFPSFILDWLFFPHFNRFQQVFIVHVRQNLVKPCVYLPKAIVSPMSLVTLNSILKLSS